MVVDAVYLSTIVGLFSVAGLTLYGVWMIAIELVKAARRRRIAATAWQPGPKSGPVRM